MSTKSALVKLGVAGGTLLVIAYVLHKFKKSKKLKHEEKENRENDLPLEDQTTFEKNINEYKSDYGKMLSDMIAKNDLKTLTQFQYYKPQLFDDTLKGLGDDLLTVLRDCNSDVKKFIGLYLFDRTKLVSDRKITGEFNYGSKLFIWLSYFGFPYELKEIKEESKKLVITESDILSNKILNVADLDVVNKLFNDALRDVKIPHIQYCAQCGTSNSVACICLMKQFVAGLTQENINLEKLLRQASNEDANWKWRDFDTIQSIWDNDISRGLATCAVCRVCAEGSSLCWCYRKKFIDTLSYHKVQFVKNLNKDPNWRTDFKEDLENFWNVQKSYYYYESDRYCESCGEKKYGCRCEKKNFMENIQPSKFYDFMSMKRSKEIFDRGKTVTV